MQVERIDVSDNVETLHDFEFQTLFYGAYFCPHRHLRARAEEGRQAPKSLCEWHMRNKVVFRVRRPRLDIPAKGLRVGEKVAPVRNARARS